MALGEVEHIDLVVCGSVAVTRDGARVGKGGGDLMLDGGIEMAAHDIPVDVIVLPDEIIEVRRRYPRPASISWELLPADNLEAIPVLRQGRVARRAR